MVLDICAVLVVIQLFAIINRLVHACDCLEDLKALLTNPNINISEDFIKQVIKMVRNSKKK